MIKVFLGLLEEALDNRKRSDIRFKLKHARDFEQVLYKLSRGSIKIPYLYTQIFLPTPLH